MMPDLATLKPSDIAAWWGAIIATTVLLWDVFKWRATRAHLWLTAQSNMRTVTSAGKLADDLNIFLEAVNNGDKTTTITHVVVRYYPNTWDRLRGKTSMRGLVTIPRGTQPLPFELRPGHRWVGLIDQKDVETKAGTGGYFYCGVIRQKRNNWCEWGLTAGGYLTGRPSPLSPQSRTICSSCRACSGTGGT